MQAIAESTGLARPLMDGGDDVPRLSVENREGIIAFRSSEFGPWGREILIDQALIDAYATLSGDQQSIHVDADWAHQHTDGGKTIAHGGLVVALLPQLTSSLWPFVLTDAIPYLGIQKTKFCKPVPVGSCVHARAKLYQTHFGDDNAVLVFVVEIAIVGDTTAAVKVDNHLVCEEA